MSVLITAASTARAYQFKNILSGNEVILGDYEELPDMMISTGKMIKLPNPAGVAYLHEMLALCLDKNISAIYPLRKTEMQLLMEAQQLFDEYGIKINYIEDAL